MASRSSRHSDGPRSLRNCLGGEALRGAALESVGPLASDHATLARAACVRYMFQMPESRITVTTEELAKSLAIWLSVVGQRRAALIRDLWTRKDERSDQANRDHARHELARYLAEQLRISGHEVTRCATASDRAWASSHQEGE